MPAPPPAASRQRGAAPALPPRARRPPRLPRVRPGKPRKPPVPRRPARARPAPPCPPRGLCAPHAANPARARLPAAARKEGSGSPRPGTTPCPRRPGETTPAPRPPRHTAASAPPPVRRRPLDSGTVAAPRRRVPLCPQGGIESLSCSGWRPRPPLVRIFAKFRGGGIGSKTKKDRPEGRSLLVSQMAI